MAFYLARELDARLAREPVTAVYLAPHAARLEVHLGRQALVWELHPEHGAVRILPVPEPERAPGSDPGTGPGGTRAGRPGEPRLPRKPVLRAVRCPPDERLLFFEVGGSGARRGRLRRVVVELLTNQLNALAIDGDGRILDALRTRRGRGRAVHAGAIYREPEPTSREGAGVPVSRRRWHALLGEEPPDGRPGRLVGAVAYMSPLAAGAILGDAAKDPAPAALDAAYERYRSIAELPPAAPCVLEHQGRPVPYPLPLPGIPARPAASLLQAVDRAAGEAPAPAAVPPAALDALDRRIRQIERKIRGLRLELEGAAPDAAARRRRADLLLSQLHRVEKGMTSVELPDYEGGHVTVELDPALTPVENANRLYEAAKKRERAAETLPALVRRGEAHRDRLLELRARAEAGQAGVAEIEAAVGEAPRPPRAGRAGLREPATLPFRRYRTSGGLEVRVGRGGRANDELTFHHSAPDDIWLHARDAAGAHVVLRWDRKTDRPPARDLKEAAVLAALHSRARTAATVPVDWTRRKHVRKPRKAAAGRVVPDRVQTIFVEPDPRLEQRLRHDAGL